MIEKQRNQPMSRERVVFEGEVWSAGAKVPLPFSCLVIQGTVGGG